MNTLVTSDTILSWLEEQVENKTPVSPQTWAEACLKLTALMGGETDKLFELQQKVALMKVALIEDGKSVAYAKTKVEASDEYKEARKQEARIERITELVRISKLRARLNANEMGMN